ncbi:putative sorting nexin-4 [Paraphysoderma sedebokerense]|nr:putative sorting nexin-4 [Paraphysoderma sedebokerense]
MNYGYLTSVTDPQKHGEGMKDAYVSYLVVTKKPNSNQEVSARRRFTDFVWLHSQLAKEYPACIIPPLPDKHRMEYITGDRFSAEFVEKRRGSLARFLNRVVRHPVLQKSKELEVFLCRTDWSMPTSSVTTAAPTTPPEKESVFENLTDSLLNALSKLKKPDPKFMEIKEEVSKLEEGLAGSTCYAILFFGIRSRSHQYGIDIEQDYTDFGAGLTSLGILEVDITDELTKVGGIFYEFAKGLKEMIQHEDIEFSSHIKEYLSYCHAVKYALKLRDQKQLDHEELSDYLAKAQIEKQKLLSGLSTSSGIGGYIKEKYEEMKGVDAETLRREKLKKCEDRITELTSAIQLASQVTDTFSSTLLTEIDFFQTVRIHDFKEIMGDYANSQATFWKKSGELWDDMAKLLEEKHI